MQVTLHRCERCELLFVKGDRDRCPSCRWYSRVPTEPVVMAGYDVEVKEVVLHGSEIGMLDKRVRDGMNRVWMWNRCRHGYITYHICPLCNKDSREPLTSP
jgi:hypothetical protein